MNWVLGIDAGGTQTRIAAVDQNGALRLICDGPNLDPTADAHPKTTLASALSEFKGAEAATIGLPYYGEVAGITTWQRQIAADVLGPMAKVRNDVHIAHLGAFAGQDGALVLAGTGSMVWALGPNGVARAGGYGHLFGDEGSAYWLGRHALEIASKAQDGRTSDTETASFARGFCDEAGIAPDGLIDWTYSQTSPRRAIAGLAPVISSLALKGQSVALTLVQDAAEELAAALNAARSASGLAATSPWAVAGGVLRDSPVMTRLRETQSLPPQQQCLPPLGGALLDAAQRAGWMLDDNWIAQLNRTLIETPQPALAQQV